MMQVSFGLTTVSEALVQELWGMLSTPSLPLLPNSLRSGVVVFDMIRCIGQLELFNYPCNHLNMCKQMTNVP